MSASPAGRGWAVPAPAARMDRTSAARNRRNATARRSAATSASVPCAAPSASRISSSDPSRVLPIAAAPTRNACASSPRSQNCCSIVVLRSWPAVRCRPWPVVVGVENRGAARGDEFVFGHDHPGGGLDEADRSVIDHDGHAGCRSAGWAPSSGPRRTGHRRAGRPCAAPTAPRSAGAATATVAAVHVRGAADRRGSRRSPNAPRR